MEYRVLDCVPVHEMDSVPGPWYSIMAPVPPATVRMSATFRITSANKQTHTHTTAIGKDEGGVRVRGHEHTHTHGLCEQRKVAAGSVPLGEVQPLSLPVSRTPITWTGRYVTCKSVDMQFVRFPVRRAGLDVSLLCTGSQDNNNQNLLRQT